MAELTPMMKQYLEIKEQNNGRNFIFLRDADRQSGRYDAQGAENAGRGGYYRCRRYPSYTAVIEPFQYQGTAGTL